MKPGRITIKDVAEAAGVHYSTVSRALNPRTRGLVADSLAERVEAAAARLGYRPDAMAASLRTGRSRLIGVVLPDVSNLVFAPILGGVEETLDSAGYRALVVEARSPEKVGEIARELISRGVDGLILATVARDDATVGRLVAEGAPVVLVNRAESAGRAPSVVSDDAMGMRLAVDHLLDLGHRRIAHLGGPAALSTGFLRRQGFEAAMREAGQAPAAVALATAYEREAGHAAARALLDAAPDLTAIVAANDLLALGAYLALAERGLRCPADVSVVGHNDMPLMDMVDPPLTTVRIGHRDMGREAARLLVARIERAEAAVGSLILAPRLVVRASTARPGTATD
jgi:LacI family transcriptional regulator